MAETIWEPQDGSQKLFMSCPVFETLYEGTRGPGKTDSLIMDFAQHVGLGFGRSWRGVLFRQSHPQLSDVISKTKKWYYRIFPDARFNEAKSTWVFPGGEELLLRHMNHPDDYWNYHGHEYPWIGWEELTTWMNDTCYKLMMSCCRSTMPGMPRKYRATTNPYGPGHNWVKSRFKLPTHRGRIIRDSIDPATGKPEPPRVAIHGHIYENQILLTADPEYIDKVAAAARNEQEKKAWLFGDWDIVAGGILDDCWEPGIHLINGFPLKYMPRQWRLDRAMDWGSSEPFSIGWWAQSNGEDPIDHLGRPLLKSNVRGDLHMFREWYGCREGKANEGVRMLAGEVASGIVDREERWNLKGLIKKGPADTNIFNDEQTERKTIASDMAKQGVYWEKADKRPGSRKQGWEQIRKLLKAIKTPWEKEVERTEPGLFVWRVCGEWVRTVPVLPRDDENLDDIPDGVEDHAGDMTRYRVRRRARRAISTSF